MASTLLVSWARVCDELCAEALCSSPLRPSSWLPTEVIAPLRFCALDCMSDRVWAPIVSAEVSRLERTSWIVEEVCASTWLTWAASSMVRSSRSIWALICDEASSREFDEESVASPGCTEMEKSGLEKFLASTTRRRSALAGIIGGASRSAHCTWVLPSESMLTRPFVVSPSPSTMTSPAPVPSSEAEATTVSGAPTSALVL